MKNQIILRNWQVEDKAAIVELLRLNTPKYFAPEEEAGLLFFLENETEEYFVAEYEDKVVGCGGIHFSEDFTVGKLSWDILHPDYQRKGIGGMLLLYRIQKLLEVASVHTISVRTSQFAWKFYEKYGFILLGVEKEYWAKGFDLYQMEYRREAFSSK